MARREKESDVSFLGKILIVFKPIYKKIKDKRIIHTALERQKELANYTSNECAEEAKLSYGFSLAKIVSAILLVSLLLVTILFGGRALSYEKVYYMFKDISYIKSFGESMPSVLSYSEPVQNQVFCSFKGGLAVASDSEIKTFTSTGRATMSMGSEFSNPKMSASDQYLLIYDQGSNAYSIYNSFTLLHSERLDYPISYAEMAPNGSFLLVTGSERYVSVVKIYDSEFRPVTEYSKNDRVISASLSTDGRYASVLSMDAKEGGSVTYLNVIDCNKNEVVSTLTYNGSMPYKCSFLTDDRIAVILDNKLCVVSRNGKLRGEYYYPSSLERIAVEGDRVALLFSADGSSSQKILAVFNKEGKMTRNELIQGSVRDLELGDDAVYLLQSGKVLRINIAIGGKDYYEVDTVDASLVVFHDGKVAVCTKALARYISFD